MPARAIWKGVLKFGSEKVPVKLYSAVEDRSVHFHILDSRTLQPVKQHMVDPDSGKEVPNDEIERGLEIDPGTFVVLKENELAKLEPKSSRDIEVIRFVPPERVNHQWYERPYYLGPDENSESSYFALAKALASSGTEGIARWVMRDTEYTGALRANDGYLILVTLRHSEEVLSPKELPKPTGRPLDKREIQMAQQLISVLEGAFDPEDFHDEYRERVLQFIEAKAKGRRLKLKALPKKTSTTSLLDALSASLNKAKRTGGKAVA
jgi:DNA end-binding protein Ku